MLMRFMQRRAGGAVPARAARQETLVGVPFEVWGQRGWPDTDVVGESNYADAIRALLPRVTEAGSETTVTVWLVHNPANPYDSNAVEVRGACGLMGYLSREDAARYALVLDGLQRRGLVAATTARVWGRVDHERGSDGFFGSVRVDLPAPHLLAPTNSAPAVPHQLLPAGAAIQVTGEEHNMAAIVPYLVPEAECWVYASVQEISDSSTRAGKPLAEVRIDGRPVGRLSPKMSGDILPLVRFLADRGLNTCVQARVKGNPVKAEVVVYTARAHELPTEWFDEIPASMAAPGGPTGSVGPPPATAAAAPARQETPPPAPPAGWYPDPYRPGGSRRWDGAAWTDETG